MVPFTQIVPHSTFPLQVEVPIIEKKPFAFVFEEGIAPQPPVEGGYTNRETKEDGNEEKDVDEDAVRCL